MRSKMDDFQSTTNRKMDTTNRKMDTMISRSELIGPMYETITRREVKERFASTVNGVMVQSILDLCRHCFPRTSFVNESPDSSIADLDRGRIIALRALKQVDLVHKWSVDKSGGKSSLAKNILHGIEELQSITDHEDKIIYLLTAPLGFRLFSTLCFKNPAYSGVIPEVEIDLMHPTKVTSNLIKVELGEVKSGKGRDRSLEQLIIALSVVFHGLKCLSSNDVVLIGTAYTNSSEWLRDQPSQNEIQSIVSRLDLDVPYELLNLSFERL